MAWRGRTGELGGGQYGHAAVYVSDLRHLVDLPDSTPGPARRMAEHLSLLVRAATAGEAGQLWVSALPCRRRPGRRACPGHLRVSRTDIPPSIEWRCTSCGVEGVISGWEGSPFDLRDRRAEHGAGPGVRVVITSEVAATLRSLTVVDTDGERVVFRAGVLDEEIVLAGDEDDLDELIGDVAFEANHEQNRRRQKRLDAAFELLNDALNQAYNS
jgi:hypothetical protein